MSDFRSDVKNTSFVKSPADAIVLFYSNSNSTFIALNLYLMIDSKTQKAKIRDRNR